MARVVCVYDEGSVVNTPLIGAKGFSMVVESGDRRILFDTGLRDRYLVHNMEHLEIDPASIDAVVVSQGHPDNCRALNGFLGEREAPVDVYAPEGLYSGKKGLLSSSVGLSDENRDKAVLHPIEGWTEVIPDVWITPPLYSADGYRESFLVVRGKRTAVISGRGYSGPELPLTAAKERFGSFPTMFVGAVLLEKKKKPVAEQYASEFESCGCTSLYLNHCVGRDGMTNLRAHFGLKGVNDLYAGMDLQI